MVHSDKSCACGARIVPWKRWRKLTPDQRAQARSAGFARAATTAECRACYCRRLYREQRRAAGHEPKPRWNSGYTRTELLAEMEHLGVNWNQPTAALCRELAPRLGMKPTTLEQRLRRYGIRSRFGYDGLIRQAAA